jgi:hypothetical protein
MVKTLGQASCLRDVKGKMPALQGVNFFLSPESQKSHSSNFRHTPFAQVCGEHNRTVFQTLARIVQDIIFV